MCDCNIMTYDESVMCIMSAIELAIAKITTHDAISFCRPLNGFASRDALSRENYEFKTKKKFLFML